MASSLANALGLLNRAKRLRQIRQQTLVVASTGTASRPSSIERWARDPVAFAVEALGVEPWELQAIVLMALVEDDRVAVRSGHKVGKSLLVAIACLWWAYTRPQAGVVATSATGRQVKLIVWREIARLAQRARRLGVIDIPRVPRDPGTGIHWDDGSYIVGFSTDQAENMGGFGGPNMLYPVDEASGVPDEIFEAIEGNTAGGDGAGDEAVAKILLTGNPTQTTGQFYRAFHQEREFWRPFRISSEQSPNVTAGRIVVPGLATRDYVERRRKAWGADSDRYRIRVLGDFPLQGAQAVIALAAVEAAAARAATSQPNGNRLVIGVDVARFGDDRSVAQPRRGTHTYKPKVVHGHAVDEVAGMVLAEARDLREPGEDKPLVNVDTIGVGGGVADILRSSGEVEVVDVNVSEVSDDPDEYPNLRSQLWFATGDWLAEGGALPADRDTRMELEGELLAPQYKFDARGRRVVEPKDKIKQRLGRSPDLADALCLSVYVPDTDRTIFRAPSRYS